MHEVFGGNRLLAGIAQLIVAFGQTMAQGHPFIKNKAITLPQAVFPGDVLKVFQYPAPEVIDLLKTEGFHVG